MTKNFRWVTVPAVVILSFALSAGSIQANGVLNPTPDRTENPGEADGASHACVQASVDKSIAINDRVFETGQLEIQDWRIDLGKGWHHRHPTNSSLTLIFVGGGWIVPTDEADLPRAVDMMIEWAAAQPDTGTRDLASGWAESATTKRLGAATCLFALSRDERLIPVIEELAAANLDPNRYYGPPRFAPHNHGVMANRALLNAGEVLNRSDWIQQSLGRLSLQLDQTFDNCGMNYEQSSGYQLLSATMWMNLVDRVHPYDVGFAQRIDSAARLARKAGERLARPDGVIEAIGNSGMRQVDQPRPLRSDLMWCPQTGWSSQTTVRSGLVQHVLTRFGPGTRFHGHADKGAATWWVGNRAREGKAILSDRGLSGKVRDSRFAYSQGTEAHSTLLWPGGSNLRLSGTRNSRGGAHHIVLRGSNRHGGWTRKITTTTTRPRLTFTDRITGGATRSPATAILTLAPGWSPVANDLFRTHDGWRLRISCSVEGGQAELTHRRVEHFAEPNGDTDAYSVWCTATSRGPGPMKIRTTLTVLR